jgi:hypothetical protein
MTKLGETIWRRNGFKIFVVAVIVIVCFAIFLFQRNREQSSGTTGIKENPTQGNRNGSARIPASGGNETRQSTFPPEDWSPNGDSEPATPGQTISGELPGDPAHPARTKVRQLPSSPTQVHSLRDAEEVMGPAPGGAGEIGVTRAYKLPDDKGSDKNSPSKPPERP